MHMNMPHINVPHMGGRGLYHGGSSHRMPPVAVMAIALFHCVFYAAATTCLLGAVNRSAGARKLSARVKALKAFPDDFTPEERAVLIDKIKTQAQCYW